MRMHKLQADAQLKCEKFGDNTMDIKMNPIPGYDLIVTQIYTESRKTLFNSL